MFKKYQEKLKDFLYRYRESIWDTAGVMTFIFALLIFLAIIGLKSGVWISNWNTWLVKSFGNIGAIFFVFSLMIVSYIMIKDNRAEIWDQYWKKLVNLELFIFFWMIFLAFLSELNPVLAFEGKYGGQIGFGIAMLLNMIVPMAWAKFLVPKLVFGFAMSIAAYNLIKFDYKSLFAPKKKRTFTIPEYKHELPQEDEEDQVIILDKTDRKLSPQYKKDLVRKARQEKTAEVQMSSTRKNSTLPPLELLEEENIKKNNSRLINDMAGLLEQSLAEFGIPAEVIDHEEGPRVIIYHVRPGYYTKSSQEDAKKFLVAVKKIKELKKDLTMALEVESIRIQAPVPGKSYIGIEIPNFSSYYVRLKGLLQEKMYDYQHTPLMLSLGRDFSGAPLIDNLAAMPHLLVAGATGSGKSVGLTAMMLSLIMNNTPDDLRFIVVDPKQVDLVLFDNLPHVMGKVVTDVYDVPKALNWLVIEMEHRYEILKNNRVRKISDYHTRFGDRDDKEKMPFIVMIIDELEEVMTLVASQTEDLIARLASKARAVGIHLIFATQKPVTDVITGVIKGNLPARLSYQVTSGMDSRVILDEMGAESLLGNGDLLYRAQDAMHGVRAQGVFVSTKEISNVVNYWAESWGPMNETIPWIEMEEDFAFNETKSTDELLERAIIEVLKSRKATASYLQRVLNVGYPKAGSLIDQLEDLGIIGPSTGGGREREILITLEDYQQEEE